MGTFPQVIPKIVNDVGTFPQVIQKVVNEREIAQHIQLYVYITLINYMYCSLK